MVGKGKDQKRRGRSSFGHLELFLKVCLVRLASVVCSVPLHQRTISLSLPCLEAPCVKQMFTGPSWTRTTLRALRASDA